MVWAVAFIAARNLGADASDCAYAASCAVRALRELRDTSCGDDIADGFVDDMLGNGADR